ncbi:hypothetical protein MBLNU13_g05924t1 [Cladosporium sp. NU13]
MVDVASITVSVVSLVTAIGVAVATGVLQIYSEERNARRETERLLRKYRDPLLLAAQDLQSRIYNITENNVLTFLHGSSDYQDCLIIYTAFLFGQYLCWTHILRQQAQFACFATEERGRNKRLVDLLGRIQTCLNTDRWGPAEEPFMLWKGHQLAIGELMTVSLPDASGSTELLCMGYAEFTRKWKASDRAVNEHRAENDSEEKGVSQTQSQGNDSEVFRGWFGYIERGIYRVERQRHHGDSTAFNRIRRLQHLLLELVEALDPNGSRARESKPVSAAPNCMCTRCQKNMPKTRAGTV